MGLLIRCIAERSVTLFGGDIHIGAGLDEHGRHHPIGILGRVVHGALSALVLRVGVHPDDQEQLDDLDFPIVDALDKRLRSEFVTFLAQRLGGFVRTGRAGDDQIGRNQDNQHVF